MSVCRTEVLGGNQRECGTSVGAKQLLKCFFFPFFFNCGRASFAYFCFLVTLCRDFFLGVWEWDIVLINP